MANWYGAARSNYFRVKDHEAFKASMSENGVDVFEGEGKTAGMVMVTPNTLVDDSGGWPRWRYDENTDEDVEIDVPELVAGHLAEGSVAVFMQCGHEKLRYLDGYAEAIDRTGKRIAVSLNDIFQMAAKSFEGQTVTDATY